MAKESKRPTPSNRLGDRYRHFPNPRRCRGGEKRGSSILNPGSLAGLLMLGTLLGACDGRDTDELESDKSALPVAVGEVVDSYMASYGEEIDGAGIVIVDKEQGVLFSQTYGEFRAEQPFLVASLSKAVSAGVILSLQDKGVLNRNERVILPSSRPDHEVQRFTFEQLLSNSSGIPCPRSGPISVESRCQFDGETSLSRCADAILKDAQTVSGSTIPDSRFCYGGRQWQLAGAAAELASGSTWDELFRENFAEPCGLRNSGYVNQFLSPIAASLGWSGYPRGVDLDKVRSKNPNIEGGLFTTLDDFGEILTMLLRQGVCKFGRVLSEDSVSRMLQDRIQVVFGGSVQEGFSAEDLRVFGQGYGLGWWVNRTNEVRSVPGAYGSTAWISPDRTYAALVATKSNGVVGRKLYEDVRRAVELTMGESGPSSE